MKRIIFGIATAILVTAGIMTGLTTSAYATNYEICSIDSHGNPASPCVNKWNNGDLIKSYTPGASNEHFETVGLQGGIVQIYDYVTGLCVGDYQNNPGDAKASDYQECPSNGAAGWGTEFYYYSTGCPAGSGVLYNRHWNAYLSANPANGSQFYLNVSSGPYCFKLYQV
jgi:hypothetical protein